MLMQDGEGGTHACESVTTLCHILGQRHRRRAFHLRGLQRVSDVTLPATAVWGV